MKKALFCTGCGAQLTGALSISSGKDPKVPALEPRDRQPLTPRGRAYKSYQPMLRTYSGEPGPLEFVPQYWLNPGDLGGNVKRTKRLERLQGCCGEAGIYGPNRLCRCGAEIGTLRDDCWTPHVFIPEPGATEWREMNQDF
jgi:hypothetical protein